MSIFNWVVASIVVISLVYISFVLTLTDWFAALRKGQAVTLLPERSGRPWPLWTQLLMILLGLGLCVPLFYYGWIPLLLLPTSIDITLDMLGVIIYLAGLSFTLWARRTLGKFWGLSTSRNVKLLNDHQLIQNGPYAFVRHPMYFGWWAAMLGITLIYPVWGIVLLFAFSVISFTGRAQREEAALAARFGSDWVQYRKKTKFIIPLLY